MKTHLCHVLVVSLILSSALAPLCAMEVNDDKKAKAESEEIAKALGRKMTYFESPNFTWSAALPIGRLKRISQHAEKAYKLFGDQAGLKTWGEIFGDQKPMGVLVQHVPSFRKYNAWYAEKYPVWDKKQFTIQMNKSQYYIAAQTRRVIVTHVKPHDDKQLRAIITHQTGHLLVHRYGFKPNFVPPWLEEGCAVWMESKVIKKHSCQCFSDPYGAISTERDGKGGFPTLKWKKVIKTDMRKKRYANLSAIFKARMYELSLQDMGKSFATVDWMMSQKGKFPEFIKSMKKHWPEEIYFAYGPEKGQAQEKAFKEVFGKTMPEIEAAVEEHVQKNF